MIGLLMPRFGQSSLKNLSEAHTLLQILFTEVVKGYDCQIIKAYRGEEEQNKAFDEGKSKLRYPESKHNKMPSEAVDAMPYPVSWSNTKRFYHFGGYVKAIAEKMGISIRWGGDWDMDNDLDDQNFNDLVHFEVIIGNVD